MTETAVASRLFVLLNPKSGSFAEPAVREALERYISCGDGSCTIHLLNEHDDLTALARAAAERGCGAVVAAGGDGSVSAVADGLIGTNVPLGIIPLGTANVLARELGIPTDIDAAARLLTEGHRVAAIDALKIDDKHFLTQAGVGIDSLMIRGTTTEGKRRFGRAAYMWTAAISLIGFSPRRFRLSIDGRALQPRSTQILLANCGAMGAPGLRWGEHIRPDDGRIDVVIVRARNLIDYLRLGLAVLRGKHRESGAMSYEIARRSVAIATTRPLPVQADGEIVGHTPIEIGVVAGALGVLVPREDTIAKS